MLRLLLALALFILPTACSAGGFVANGHPVERVYVAPGPGEPIRTAVDELNHHLGKVGAAKLTLVETDDPGQVKGPAIVLGELAVRMGAVPEKTSVSKEGFRLLTRNGLLLIGGESDEGTLFGTYEVLKRLGFDWVMPGEIGEIRPPPGPLRVPRLDESQAPDFAMRRLWYRGSLDWAGKADRERFAQWMRRQKAGDYKPVAAQVAGHAWPGFIKRHQAAFGADTTLYALRRNPDGTVSRRGPQLEAADPRIAKMFADDIRARFEKEGWPKDKTVGFPIGPADGAGYSISPMARAAGSGARDPITGEPDQTDTLVLLGNRILADLGGEYPNVYVGFYSYGSHAGYPRRYRPDPRIAVVFAPINFSRYHSLADPLSRTQPYYRAVVDAWSKLHREQGNPLLFRGYNWNLAENMLPFTKLRIWGEALPYYKQAGVSGLNVEATKAWGVNGPSNWLFMQLAWNADGDWRDLLDGYAARSFGAGAAPMKRYLLRIADTQREAGQEAGSYHAIPLIFDRAFVAAARADLAEAKRLARTPEQKTRIGYFEPSVDLLDEYLAYYEAANRFDFAAARQAFEAMHTTWQAAYEQNPDIAAVEAPQYLDRFIGPFVTQARTYSSGGYRIVERLPDTLETAVGEVPTDWRRTQTYSSTWDAQRLSGHTVRYRYAFTADTRPLYLFLGSFNDEATVFVNGVAVGSSGRRFSRPAVFDLTDVVKPGENELVIRITRNQALNELGVGGLFRPSFLFTGETPPEGLISR